MLNPNWCECRHCRQVFDPRFEGHGFQARCSDHERQCLKNPANSPVECRHCRQVFDPRYEGHGFRALCSDHEKQCPENPENWCHHRRVYTMYHGTQADRAVCIERSGFIPSTGGMLGPGVYLSRSLEKASHYGGVVLEVRVDVGKVKRIDRQGHDLQKTWHLHGYDSAWVPPNCGMVPSNLEETCVYDPQRVHVVRRVQG